MPLLLRILCRRSRRRGFFLALFFKWADFYLVGRWQGVCFEWHLGMERLYFRLRQPGCYSKPQKWRPACPSKLLSERPADSVAQTFSCVVKATNVAFLALHLIKREGRNPPGNTFFVQVGLSTHGGNRLNSCRTPVVLLLDIQHIH